MDASDGVYPPLEDTYLLIDALMMEADFLVDKCLWCIEVGCGSGEVTRALSSILPKSFCISSDVNSLATEKTRQLLANDEVVNVDSMLCDMFTAFRPGILFDLIIFNPPYVPTDQDELDRALQERDIAASWAGGTNGREIIDRFLSEFLRFLKIGGIMYLVLIAANNPEEVRKEGERQGCSVKTILSRKAGMEELSVMRFIKD